MTEVLVNKNAQTFNLYFSIKTQKIKQTISYSDVIGLIFLFEDNLMRSKVD
jgi:hypothetical protein